MDIAESVLDTRLTHCYDSWSNAASFLSCSYQSLGSLSCLAGPVVPTQDTWKHGGMARVRAPGWMLSSSVRVPRPRRTCRVWLQTSLHLDQGSKVGGYKSIRRLQLEKLSKLNPHSRSFSGIQVG